MRATPFTIADAFLEKRFLATIAGPSRHAVLPMAEYQERATIEIDLVGDVESSVEQVWIRFQNIDDDHLTPDGGRSMMTGDLVRIVDDGERESWWIACSIGFASTTRPTDEIVTIGGHGLEQGAMVERMLARPRCADQKD